MAKDTKLSLALLDSILICGQCGALFLAVGWSNETHLEWHRQHEPTAKTEEKNG